MKKKAYLSTADVIARIYQPYNHLIARTHLCRFNFKATQLHIWANESWQ